MRTRLRVQEDSVTNPLDQVKYPTKTLVKKLLELDPTERIGVVVKDNKRLHHVEYIRIVNKS